MTKEAKGTSDLALLADDLPVRARVCLTLLAADVAMQRLQRSPDFHLARDTLTFALDWQKSGRVDLDKWVDMLDSEQTGILWAGADAQDRSKEEGLAWRVLSYPIYYAAYHAILAANRKPPSSFCNVDESVLDYLDNDLRVLAPSSMALMTKATAYLKKHPAISFAQLKQHLI
jgi:hypothetical protein